MVAELDTRVMVGSVELSHPVMTASGTSGHGAELAPYFDLSSIGAVVVKSLSVMPWSGNPAPRLHPIDGGMINAVGLQGPGVERWFDESLPGLVANDARVVISIWGRTATEFVEAARAVATGIERRPGADRILAVEVNLSCPNLEGRRGIFAHDPDVSADVVAGCRVAGRPLWAKLSPNTDRLVEVAGVVSSSGAEAVTLINTVVGMVLDPETGRPVLGNGGGGVSGRIIHPMAVRAVHDVHQTYPDLPIVGVGGVVDAASAVDLMRVGARAVQVGTATFADPRATHRVARSLDRWATERGVRRLADLSADRVG